MADINLNTDAGVIAAQTAWIASKNAKGNQHPDTVVLAETLIQAKRDAYKTITGNESMF